MAPKSKLYRNLKAGDMFKVETGWGIRPYRCAIVTVTKVVKLEGLRFARGTAYEVYGNFPWWWGRDYIYVYASERVTLWNPTKE